MKNQPDAVATALSRFEFYRDRYRLAVKALVLMAAAVLVLTISNVLLAMRTPAPRYFAAEQDGRLIPMVSLDRPTMDQAGLLNWTARAVAKAYTVNHAQWREQLQDASAAFTKEGFDSFLSVMQERGNLTAIRENHLIATAVVTAAPVIRNEGIQVGIYSYETEFPMVITYRNSSDLRTQDLIVKATVVRVQTTAKIEPKVSV